MSDMAMNGAAPVTFPDGTTQVDPEHVTNALLQAILQAASAGSSAQDTREMGEAAKAALAYAQAVVILHPDLTAAGEPLAHQAGLEVLRHANSMELEQARTAGSLAVEKLRGQHAAEAAKERAAAPTPAKGAKP